MENTGIYSTHLTEQLSTLKGDCYVGNALHIKLSLGIAREKNDKVDAMRLARFAWKNRDELRLNIQSRFIISHLKELSTLRKRLIGVKLIMKAPLSEQSAFWNRVLLPYALKSADAQSEPSKLTWPC